MDQEGHGPRIEVSIYRIPRPCIRGAIVCGTHNCRHSHLIFEAHRHAYFPLEVGLMKRSRSLHWYGVVLLSIVQYLCLHALVWRFRSIERICSGWVGSCIGGFGSRYLDLSDLQSCGRILYSHCGKRRVRRKRGGKRECSIRKAIYTLSDPASILFVLVPLPSMFSIASSRNTVG